MFRTCAAVAVPLLALVCLLTPQDMRADEMTGLSEGQTLYAAAYSSIYSGAREQPFLLTVTLSIRNIDPDHEIKLSRVDYHEPLAKLPKTHVEEPLTLNPLGTIRYVIPEKDRVGRSGAYFIVEWSADRPVNPPLVESIMIGTQSQQGISFASRARVIEKSE